MGEWDWVGQGGRVMKVVVGGWGWLGGLVGDGGGSGRMGRSGTG